MRSQCGLLPSGNATPAPCDVSHCIADSSPKSPCSRGVSTSEKMPHGDANSAPWNVTSSMRRRDFLLTRFLTILGGLPLGRIGRGIGMRVLRRYHRTALGCDPAVWRADLRRLRRTAGASPASPPPSPPASIPRRPGPFFRFVPGFLLAGPGPIVRGLRFSAVQEKGHPHDEHVYLWFLAVDPEHQRGGVGRALLARVYGDARTPQAPVYLDTANPANVPYYASFGFEEIGRADGPRGATDVVYEASLRRCASGSPSSFFSVLFSIWRIRSRVTPNARPTSSSVRAFWPAQPVAHLDHLALARRQRVQRPPHVLAPQVLATPARTATRPSRPRRSRPARSPPPRRSASPATPAAARCAGCPSPRAPSTGAPRRSPPGSARGRTPAPAGAPRARPCSASPPCAPGCGSCAPCRRSRASRPGGSTTSRRSRTCSRAGSRTSRPRGSGPATPPGSGPGTTARGPR